MKSIISLISTVLHNNEACCRCNIQVNCQILQIMQLTLVLLHNIHWLRWKYLMFVQNQRSRTDVSKTASKTWEWRRRWGNEVCEIFSLFSHVLCMHWTVRFTILHFYIQCLVRLLENLTQCIHVAIVAPIVAATTAATVTPCIHYRRPVGATIAPTVAATFAPCIRPIRLILIFLQSPEKI